MATFKSKEELLKAIEVGFEAINQGTINLEQMDELVNSARDLYERTVIIRHKSLELLVANKPVHFEKDVHETVAPVVENPTANFETEELIIDEPIAPTEDETPIIIANDIVEDKTVFESSFSVQEKEDGFAFDLFEPSADEEPQDLFAGEVTEETFVQQEPTAEQYEEEPDVEMPKAIHEIMQENISEFSVDSIFEEETPLENTFVETPVPAQTTEIPTNGDSSFFSTYNTIASNPQARMIAPKIDSLTAAFGLGEKLMYIRELFNGSSDTFNQIVDVLEQKGSFEDAKQFLNGIAVENNWNLENQATVDFVNKVERRFF
ncbi:MAG TPA: hypothetical protein PLP27_05920 [Crocinitomicaceae bacterium]|nr:hypothetical protein [Crocinitomicaceae bacterium]